MRSRSARIAVGVFAGAALAVTSVASVSAHEHRTVSGFSILLGWRDEPTFTGVRNAVQIFLADPAGKPINDLGTPTSLQVVAVYKDHVSQPLDLESAYDPDSGEGTPGEWDGPIIPERAGTYAFHLTGTINGTAIDQLFTSSDTTFDNVQNRRGIEFPGGAEKAPKPADSDSSGKSGMSGMSVAPVAIPLAILLAGARLVGVVRRRRGA